MHRSDAGTWLDGAAEVALLQATIQSSRQISCGLTHDLNAALDALSDALFAIRDDAERGVAARERSEPHEAAPEESSDLATSLRLADEAYERLAHVARVLPGLVLPTSDQVGPVNLTAELLDLVGLTWHYWHDHVDVVVEIDPAVEPFWCAWWIVRHVALRLLVSAIATQRARAEDTRCAVASRVRLVGTQQDAEIVLRVVCEPPAMEELVVSRLTVEPELDPLLVACATRLGGTLTAESTPGGRSQSTLRFPVQLQR
jgi:signal transduction histidine kinase